MNKNFLLEVNGAMAIAEVDQSLQGSSVLHVKVSDLYKIAIQMFGEDHVKFIADFSKGEAEDNLRRFEFAKELMMFNPDLALVIKEKIISINLLRGDHMRCNEAISNILDVQLPELEASRDAIMSHLINAGIEEDSLKDIEGFDA